MTRLLDTLASEKIWISYGYAITAGAAVFMAESVLIATFLQDKIIVEPSHLFESAVILAMRAIFVWTTALAANFVPFFIMVVTARSWVIRSVVYYILCGLLTGIVMTPIFATFLPPALKLDKASANVWEQSLSIGPCFLLSYLVGSLVFWWKTGRFMNGAAVRGRQN